MDCITASQNKPKKGERAQSLYPSQLRAIHNMAKAEFNDEDMGVIRIPYSPFKKVKLPKIPVTRKGRWMLRPCGDLRNFHIRR